MNPRTVGALGIVGAGAGIGAAIPLAGTSTGLAALVAATPLAPLIAVGLARSRSVALFALVAVQPLEGYEVHTPVGTLSVGIMLLAFIVAVWHREVWDALTGTPTRRKLAALIFVFFALHIFRLAHTPASSVARQFVQYGSYAAMLAVGAWAGQRRLLRPVALGAAVALLTMGFLGMLVSKGLFPPPDRFAPDVQRTIFGVTSPFARNYGTSLPYDATAFLVPLVMPLLALTIVGPRSGGKRLWAMLGAAALLFMFLFVFQARGMLLQWTAAMIVAVLITTRGFLRTIVMLGLGVATAQAYRTLAHDVASADKVSTTMREDGAALSRQILLHEHQWILFGMPNTEIVMRFKRVSFWARELNIPDSYQPIHNFFLNELVASGLVPGLLLISIWLVVGTVAARRALSSGDVMNRALAIGFALLTIGVMVEPTSSNALGLWILIGMIIGSLGYARERTVT